MAGAPQTTTESNDVLKYKFTKLHTTVIDSIDAGNVINFLFQEGVIGASSFRRLLQKKDPWKQCTELLALLHTSHNPQTFIQLYLAIKNESHLQWLVERIDNFTDPTVVGLQLQQTHIGQTAVDSEAEQSRSSATVARQASVQPSSSPAQRCTCTTTTTAAALYHRLATDVESVRHYYLHSSQHIIRQFPRGDEVWAVTLLNNDLYVLRDRDTDQVDVYSTTADFSLLRRLHVTGLSRAMWDMTSCVQKQCVYISDCGNTCVQRVGLDKSVCKWPVSGEPVRLSVTRSCNLLVTCRIGFSGKLVELSSDDGRPVREIQSDVVVPWHSVQLDSGQYLVCYGIDTDTSRVSVVGADGRVVRSNSRDVELDYPRYIALDDNGFVFVADNDNKRIVLLDPALNYLRNVLQDMESEPLRLCFDSATGRLYVGQLDGTVLVIQL